MRPVIVCVDDDWDILKSLGNQLKRRFGKHYDVELANSATEALLLCAEISAEGQEIPLIISDQRMPGMEGDALLIQLHTLYPKTLKIMLTGQADVHCVGNVVNAAALYRFIPKPWDEVDLVLTVSEALRRFQQDQQISEQNELLKKTNAKLNSSLSLLLATLEASVDAILVLDNMGKVVSFNQRFTQIWEINASDVTSHEDDLLDIILGRLIEPHDKLFKQLLTQVCIENSNHLKLKNGSIIEYYLRPQKLMGEVVGRVWSFRDVTQEIETEKNLKRQVLHDVLTKLPNRIFLDQMLKEMLDKAHHQTKLFAVMFLDLDHFKTVNDSLGHLTGDLLLQSVAQRLVSGLRESDILARWGGDEFVILLPHIRHFADAIEVAQRLIDSLQVPFFLEGQLIRSTISIGIAIYPHDGLDEDTLLQNADLALYQAKHSGRNNYQYYSDLSGSLRGGLDISS